MIIYVGIIALFIYARYNEYITNRECAVLVLLFVAAQAIGIIKHNDILIIASLFPLLIYFVVKIYGGDVRIR